MIEHTPGPWMKNYPYVWSENDHGSYRVHCTFSTNVWGNDGNCTPEEENRGNARLVAAVHTAPHECADPQCPGNVNRRKLEAFDELLAAATNLAYSLNSTPKSGPTCWCNPLDPDDPSTHTGACDRIRAAIAEATNTGKALE